MSTIHAKLGGLLLIAVLATGCSSTSSSTGTSSSSTTTAAGSTSTSTATGSSTTSGTDTSAAPPPTATPTPPPSGGTPPAKPTITSAGAGGGGGELQMEWAAVSGATSYVVYRSTTSAGPWTVVAEINVVSGYTNVAPEVLNLYGDAQNFHPGGYSTSGTSTVFTYIESSVVSPAWFKVRAYNAAGQGPSSDARCASLMGTSC